MPGAKVLHGRKPRWCDSPTIQRCPPLRERQRFRCSPARRVSNRCRRSDEAWAAAIQSFAPRALGALEAVEPQSRLGYSLLSDAVRYVRLEAARVLASVPADLMTPVQTASLDAVLEEYRNAQLVNADRAGYHLNLAVIDQQRGELESAESSLRTALRLDPLYTPAYVNLADVYRLSNRDRKGEEVLRKGFSDASR